VKAIEGDDRSGSSDLLERCAEALEAHLDHHGTEGLKSLLRSFTDAHPTMALLHALSAYSEDALPHGADAVLEALLAFRTGLSRARAAATGAFCAFVGRKGISRAAAYSRSGQVRECLSAARDAGLREVILSEARPAGEGVDAAREFENAGLEVVLTADAALPSLLCGAQAVVVGSDAWTGDSFYNKVGTATLLREARRLGLPSVVLTVPQKELAPGTLNRWSNKPLDCPPECGEFPWHGDLFEAVPWSLATQAFVRK